jgi:precorrin-3B C17-methyltransferase
VRAWLPATPTEPWDIGRERERADRALDLALAGRRVAVVSSGDAGIYGMAGLVFEALETRGLAHGSDQLVEVIPGVTAASAAAAALGAPLMADFAVLSLSDLQVPWAEIERRLDLLAQSGMTLALYNPTSRRRADRFARARQVLLAHRPPETPVALVRNALRPQQEVHHTNLGNLPEQRVDMWTLVLVAGAGMQRIGPWLVMPRRAASARRD